MRENLYVVLDGHRRIKRRIIDIHRSLEFIEDLLGDVDYLGARDNVTKILSTIKGSASRLDDLNSSRLDILREDIRKNG